MAGTTIPVVPGASQQVNGPLTAGATLKNNDSVNSIWVSSSQAVLPMSGIEITPLGTVTWIADGKQVYACVDTGVVKPVLLTISSDANQSTDPVVVAAATAAQLLAQGVPSVLLNTFVGLQFNAASGFVDNYPNGINQVGIGGFAGLVIAMNGSGPSLLRLDFYPGVIYSGISYSEYLSSIDGSNIVFTIPVNSGAMTITNLSAGTVSYTVYGTNRAPGNKILVLGNQNLTRQMAYLGSTPGTNAYQLVANDGGAISTQFNGQCTATFNVTGTGTTIAYVYFTVLTPGGIKNFQLFPATPGPALNIIEFSHPVASVEWFMYYTGTNANGHVYVNIGQL